MKFKTILLAMLFILIQPINAKSSEYDTGIKLASCAGKSKYIAFMLKDNESYIDAQYHSLKEGRYKLSATHSFIKYGMSKNSSKEHASEIMNEEYIALALQYSDFISRPIGKDPLTIRGNKNDAYRIDKLNEIIDSSSIKGCTALEDTVKSYVKEYRMIN